MKVGPDGMLVGPDGMQVGPNRSVDKKNDEK
jgi:hypothetical protein